MFAQRNVRILVFLLVAISAIAVLAPGLPGPFLLDDFANITDNPALQPETWDLTNFKNAAVSNDSGPTGRPVSMLTFALNAATTGLSPLPMKLTNILLHALAAALFTMLGLQLFRSAPSTLTSRQRNLGAALAGIVWAVHPLSVTSTLYVVQRMNLLSALFVLAAMLAYLQGRKWLGVDRSRLFAWLGLAVLCWALGILSKENAVLLPVYVLLAEYLVLGFRDGRGQLHRRWRKALLLSASFATLIAGVGFVLMYDAWSAASELRGFSVIERLMTEARVVWHYAGMALLPSHGRLGLFLDDIALSAGLFAPFETILSIAGVLALVIVAFVIRHRAPLVSFGLMFFLGGHMLESSVIPLEIAFEHRNFLPSAGLMIALSAALQHLAARSRIRLLEWLPLGAFVVFLAFFTSIRSAQWSNEYVLAQLEAFHHPESSRAQTQLGFVYTQFARQAASNGADDWSGFYMEAAAESFQKAAAADPDAVTPLFLWMLHARAHGTNFDDDTFESLLDRLSSAPPAASLPGNLDMMFECVMEGCGVSPVELEYLLRVSLENPLLKGRIRSETSVVAAKYFSYVRKDEAAALALLKQAVLAAPRIPRFHLYLAKQFLDAGDLTLAREQALIAAELDEWDSLGPKIRNLLGAIKTASKGANRAVR